MGAPGFILFLAGVTALGFSVSRFALAWGRGLPDAPLCLALAWPVGSTLVAGLTFAAWLVGWPPFTAGF
ncbi:MAG: hypothetical protein KKC37_02050, partial [Proteobacteria bacterium]|nr:hypothetical protein [Pseudomonadota bacterium]